MFCTGIFFLLLHTSFFNTVYAGKVLVWPTDASHFLNLKIILDNLANRSHEVTVLLYSAVLLPGADTNKDSSLRYEHFEVPFTKEENEKFLEEFLSLWIFDVPDMSYWAFYQKMKELVSKKQKLEKHMCDGVLKNKTLLKKLEDEKFDVLISDPLIPCGELIAEVLGLPFVYSLRFSMANSMERLCGHLPSPFSYVPGAMAELTDKMSFVERWKNINFYLFQDILFYFMYSRTWDGYYREALV
ncbi:UDP-glucuronosyltransferase 2A1-like [Pyxicephalus adspersus]|uniref:UDP-glucuronosyltransferase 2A1-like n=1 Tax=Pyxicephalus adspersus TaxID=30357 RepID=UPI003B5C852C